MGGKERQIKQRLAGLPAALMTFSTEHAFEVTTEATSTDPLVDGVIMIAALDSQGKC